MEARLDGAVQAPEADLRDQLADLVEGYPEPLRTQTRRHVERFAFEVGLVRARRVEAISVCDIGGGWGTFALGCSLVGMRAIVVDDFGDPSYSDPAIGSGMRRLWQKHGVDVRSRDVVSEGFGFERDSLDVVTTFDSLEHWHHSPKRMLHQVAEALRPGGLFLAATPNAANLRKRLTAPFGRTKWSAMEDWYEQEVFRGHVREPMVEDLEYIARDMGLTDVEVLGRNWIGYHSAWTLARRLTPLADRALRLFPSLCSDLYMLGTVPR